MPSVYDHLLYRIFFEVGTKRYDVSNFEYRSNPVIGNITSRISIVRFVLTIPEHYLVHIHVHVKVHVVYLIKKHVSFIPGRYTVICTIYLLSSFDSRFYYVKNTYLVKNTCLKRGKNNNSVYWKTTLVLNIVRVYK